MSSNERDAEVEGRARRARAWWAENVEADPSPVTLAAVERLFKAFDEKADRVEVLRRGVADAREDQRAANQTLHEAMAEMEAIRAALAAERASHAETRERLALEVKVSERASASAVEMDRDLTDTRERLTVAVNALAGTASDLTDTRRRLEALVAAIDAATLPSTISWLKCGVNSDAARADVVAELEEIQAARLVSEPPSPGEAPVSAVTAAETGRDVCDGCKREIDPSTCHCGDPKDAHTSEHGFIPMGCDCYRTAPASASPVAETGPTLHATDLDCGMCGARSGEPCVQIIGSVLPGGVQAGDARRLPHPDRLGNLRVVATPGEKGTP